LLSHDSSRIGPHGTHALTTPSLGRFLAPTDSLGIRPVLISCPTHFLRVQLQRSVLAHPCGLLLPP